MSSIERKVSNIMRIPFKVNAITAHLYFNLNNITFDSQQSQTDKDLVECLKKYTHLYNF